MKVLERFPSRSIRPHGCQRPRSQRSNRTPGGREGNASASTRARTAPSTQVIRRGTPASTSPHRSRRHRSGPVDWKTDAGRIRSIHAATAGRHEPWCGSSSTSASIFASRLNTSITPSVSRSPARTRSKLAPSSPHRTEMTCEPSFSREWRVSGSGCNHVQSAPRKVSNRPSSPRSTGTPSERAVETSLPEEPAGSRSAASIIDGFRMSRPVGKRARSVGTAPK